MKSYPALFFLLIILSSSYCLKGQFFEGTITYHVAPQNPNPEAITDEDFAESLKSIFGEKGYMIQKYFYKQGSYLSEIEAGDEIGYQLLNTEDSLLYSWAKDSDEAQTVDSKKNMDEFVELVETDETEEILGYQCKKITLKSKLGETHIWYAEEEFRVDLKYFKDHLYGHFAQLIAKTGVLPLKSETKGFMGHFIQTAVSYELTEVSDDKFILPSFSTVTANPIN